MSAESWDLIVVGAGTAGLPCAIEAAETGGRVLLVEKAGSVGGTLHLSGGHFSAGGTRRQRARGIEDSPDAHFADILRISQGTVRHDLVRRAVDLAPAMVDWLDEHGFDFAEDTPRIVYGHEPYDTPRTYYGANEGRSLLELFARLLQPHVDRGAVDLWLESSVERLLVDDSSEDRAKRGAVCGVEVRSSGRFERVRAPAVVLASGGIAASHELFEELHERPLVSASSALATGEGIRMARSIGAAVAGEDKYLPTFGGLPDADDPAKAQWIDRPLLVANERAPWEIYVDRAGKRFVAEDEPSMHKKEEALAEIPDLTFFTIFDDRAVAESKDIVVDWAADDVRRAAGVREGVFSADSIETLAFEAGIDPGELARTVARFNAAVANGVDPEFGRHVLLAPIERPPFYAMRNHGITLIAFAGLDVDAELRVRDEGGVPIPGLFALGEAIGAGATCGRSFCSGMMVGPAISFGREIGRALAGRGVSNRSPKKRPEEEGESA